MSERADSFTNRNVLITGGAGFIGSNLARRLAADGARVTLVDSMIPDYGGNPANLDDSGPVILNVADVRDPFSMNHLIRGQDYLFNLAGQVSHTDSMREPYTDLDINVRAQLSILEACRHHNRDVRIVFASTRQIYGRPSTCPVDESHPLRPVDVNGINKLAGETYHLHYGKIYGIPVTSLRLTNTYGPRMRIKDPRQTFVGWWIRQIIEERPLQIFGDGCQRRDFNYVDDVVEAMLLCATETAAIGAIYNLGGRAVSLQELAETLIEVNGKGSYEMVPFPEERKAIDIGSYQGDYGRIAKALGWQPQIQLGDGLARTLAYFRPRLDAYV